MTDRLSSSSSQEEECDDAEVTMTSAWRRFVDLSSDSEDDSVDDVDGADVDEVDGLRQTSSKRRRASNMESIVNLWMRERQKEFTQIEYFTVFCGTWNVNGQEPSTDLREWLSARDEDASPDIYAIGFQELDVSMSAHVISYSSQEDAWIDKVAAALSQKFDYRMVEQRRMVGIMLLVFARTALCDAVGDIAAADVGTGLLGVLGNKGGVGVRFQLHNTTICFVCSHLAAHTEDIDGRNEDFDQISSRLIFSPDSEITDHDVVFWLGDLNYRLDNIDNDECKAKISKGQLDDLWRNNDQLRREMSDDGAFSEFVEGRITFNPTFKYDPGTDNWDSSAKNRTPSWCDRILWYGDNINQLLYRSHPSFRLSDHKPVSAVFRLGVKVLKPQLQQQVHDDVSNVMLQRQHRNRSLPKVSLDAADIKFRDVKLMEVQRRRITLTNIGNVPVQFEFVSQETGCHDWKRWLIIHPKRGFIHCGTSCKTHVYLEVLVDRRSATELNSGKDQLKENLIIRVQGGDDLRLNVSGNYVSSFGSRSDNLPQRSRYGSAMPSSSTVLQPLRTAAVKATSRAQRSDMQTEDMVEGDGQLSTPAGNGVPLEIQWLVDLLVEQALDKDQLFEVSGMQSELRAVFECLDNGTPDKLVRYVHSATEALLMLLDSYDEPVIPYEFYQSCIDASDDHSLSRQVLSRIPENHRNLFEYICEFCRTLLKHSDKNKLSASLLASVFGSILLRPCARPADDDKPTRARFVRHFIDVAA